MFWGSGMINSMLGSEAFSLIHNCYECPSLTLKRNLTGFTSSLLLMIGHTWYRSTVEKHHSSWFVNGSQQFQKCRGTYPTWTDKVPFWLMLPTRKPCFRMATTSLMNVISLLWLTYFEWSINQSIMKSSHQNHFFVIMRIPQSCMTRAMFDTVHWYHWYPLTIQVCAWFVTDQHAIGHAFGLSKYSLKSTAKYKNIIMV